MANLITLEDYKDAKGLQNVKDDTRIESLISSVSQLVKTYWEIDEAIWCKPDILPPVPPAFSIAGQLINSFLNAQNA